MSTTKFETNEAGLKNRKWIVIDGAGQTVGRLASKIAASLRGKNNPRFAPHQDVGEFVVVINAAKMRFTGQKSETKLYRHHTGYVGGVKTEPAGKLLARKPEQVLFLAVKGMLPKTPLGRKQLTKLKVYTGPEHRHQAQVAGSAA